jgi:polar amino acid transport system permease protein
MRQLSWSDLGFIVFALRWTLALSASAFVGGGIAGMAVALARTARTKWLTIPAAVYIHIVQGTPLLVQLFLIFFGSDMIGLPLGAWLSAALGLSFNAGAFLGEIWRSAIQSVARGQVEAGRSLGLHYWPIMLRIVLPQALRVAIPPTVGFLVQLIKSTSLAALVGFVEVYRAGQMINNATIRPIAIFGFVALLYYALCRPLTIASFVLERHLATAYKR